MDKDIKAIAADNHLRVITSNGRQLLYGLKDWDQALRLAAEHGLAIVRFAVKDGADEAVNIRPATAPFRNADYQLCGLTGKRKPGLADEYLKENLALLDSLRRTYNITERAYREQTALVRENARKLAAMRDDEIYIEDDGFELEILPEYSMDVEDLENGRCLHIGLTDMRVGA